jgi:hypothetical protein
MSFSVHVVLHLRTRGREYGRAGRPGLAAAGLLQLQAVVEEGGGGAPPLTSDFGSREACLRSFPIANMETRLQRACPYQRTHAQGANMQGDSSGLLESIAAGLLCVVALAAVHRNDGDAPVCRAEPAAIQRAAPPVQRGNAAIEAEIKEMRLHD